MAFSETHIIDGEYDENEGLFQVPSYTFLKRNRQAGKGGELAMFIRDGIKWERRHDLENDDVEVGRRMSTEKMQFRCTPRGTT